jgi:hypothetical protein
VVHVSPAVCWALTFSCGCFHADSEGYSCQGKKFNPFSPETREQHQALFLYVDVETGKAFNEADQVHIGVYHYLAFCTVLQIALYW